MAATAQLSERCHKQQATCCHVQGALTSPLNDSIPHDAPHMPAALVGCQGLTTTDTWTCKEKESNTSAQGVAAWQALH